MAALQITDDFIEPIKLSDIEYGLTHARWPARLQKIERGPFINLLPFGYELWIDGGHNDSCGQVLARQAQKWGESGDLELHLILGMLNTKNPLEFYEPLSPFASSTACLSIPDQPLTLEAEELAGILQEGCSEKGASIYAVQDLQKAIEQIIRRSNGPCRILVTGSLYLMGAVLKDHQ